MGTALVQFRLWQLLVGMAACALLAAFFKAVVIPLACLGQIRDLPESELQTLDRLRAAGVSVSDSAPPCTFRPSAVVNVRWCNDGQFHVVSMSILGDIPLNDLEPALAELPRLEQLKLRPFNEWTTRRLQGSLPNCNIAQ